MRRKRGKVKGRAKKVRERWGEANQRVSLSPTKATNGPRYRSSRTASHSKERGRMQTLFPIFEVHA